MVYKKKKNQPKKIVLEKVNFGLPNLTKPKKKKKSLGIQQNITTLSQYLYFQLWWISI